MEQQHCNANHQVAGPLKFSYFIALWATIDSETPAGLQREAEQKHKQRHNPNHRRDSNPKFISFTAAFLPQKSCPRQNMLKWMSFPLVGSSAFTNPFSNSLLGSWLSEHLFQIV